LNFFRAIYNYLGTMAIAIHYLGAMADATTSMPWLSVSPFASFVCPFFLAVNKMAPMALLQPVFI